MVRLARAATKPPGPAMSNDIVKFAAIIGVAAVVGGQYLSGKTPEVALAVKASAAPASAAATARPAAQAGGLGRTEIMAGRSGHYQAKVEIDGRQLDMLVDTGATIVALSNEDAGRIGVHPSQSDYTVPMSTANGVAKAARVRLREVRVGQVSAHDVEAVVMPAGLLRESLLGMSFLKQISGFEVASGRLVLRQ